MLNPDFARSRNRTTIADWRVASEHRRLDTHTTNLLEESSLPHLLRYEDRNAGAFGVESRVPYLDHRLVDFCRNEGSAFRIRDGWTKWVLRKAMERTVPRDIVWRRDKVGFETPETAWLVEWMRSDPDFFGSDSLVAPYLDLFTVRSRIASWTERNGTGPDVPVWRWINLELWLSRFSRLSAPHEEVPVGETPRPRLTLLTPEEVERIVEQALQVLATTGVLVENEEALTLLDGAGQRIEGGRAHLTEEVVRQALAGAPSRISTPSTPEPSSSPNSALGDWSRARSTRTTSAAPTGRSIASAVRRVLERSVISAGSRTRRW